MIQHFPDIPNWHLFGIVYEYAIANGKKCITLEQYNAAIFNYLSFAINKN